MRNVWKGLLTTLALHLVASPSFGATGLDINDVAVLFPNDSAHKPVPNINLANSSLVNPKTLASVLARATELGISPAPTSSIKNGSDWSIRGFRVDPCAPEVHGASIEPCLFELRLIAQPNAFFSPADNAMHLIYKIKAGKPSADEPLLLDLLQLKRESEDLMKETTTGQALNTHPLLLSAMKAKRSDVPALFSNFLLKYAHKRDLSKITMMGLRNGSPTDWIFFGGDLNDGVWKAGPIPNHSSRSQTPFVELSVTEGAKSFKGAIQDQSLALQSVFNGEPETLPARVAEVSETVFKLENPSFSDRNTVDCVSCHAATTTRMVSEPSFPVSLSGVSREIPKGITAFPAMGTIQNHPLHWNLRAFGYFGLQASFNFRTIHEAAESAVQINEILGLSNPSFDCQAKADEVFQCLIQGTLQPNGAETTASCLARCEAPRNSRSRSSR